MKIKRVLKFAQNIYCIASIGMMLSIGYVKYNRDKRNSKKNKYKTKLN